MDFGFMSSESLVGPTETPSLLPPSSPDNPKLKPKPKPKLGSGFLKKERSGPEKPKEEDEEEPDNDNDNDDDDDDNYRPSKVAKTMALRSNSLFHGSSSEEAITSTQNLISFSSDNNNNNKSELLFSRNSYTPRNTGYGLNQATMHVGMNMLRGPFTPSQWIELEHQALIYKYITSNVPIPSNLLLPIKKSLNPFPFPPLLSTSFGWGHFQMGFADSSDPEPGRCRRTDGKKWRCSKDAVADQKYCERHINRGRHRSRKPVEAGQHQQNIAQSVSSAAAKTAPIGAGGGGFKAVHSAGASMDSTLAKRMQELSGVLSVTLPSLSSSSAFNIKSDESTFAVPKQETVLPSEPVFGLVSTDSLLNPSQDASYITSKAYASPFLDFGTQGGPDHQNNPLRHFIDDWPKDESTRPVIAWPTEDTKPEWTQLSMSIPMTSSEFSSSSNSPKKESLRALSPLRLSREFDQKQSYGAHWAPISWGISSNCAMGGPLGEVLTNTSSGINPNQHCGNPSSSLNLLAEGWDGSPQLGSSPTGVLQKSTFCSLSNSSTGSSPRADNNNSNNNGKRSNNADGMSGYEEVIGSTLASSSVPSL